jgi:type VI secretion system secreted protein Hcp
MANMFLSLTGVTGESIDADKKLEGAIEIHEWVWGLHNAAPYRLKESDATTHASVDKMTVTKMIDKASVTLVNFCAHGKEVSKATITCRKNTEDGPVDYLTIELNDVKIRSVNWPGRGEDLRGVPEVVVLEFKKFTMSYSMQLASGLLEGANVFPFDIPEQKGQPAKPGK